MTYYTFLKCRLVLIIILAFSCYSSINEFIKTRKMLLEQEGSIKARRSDQRFSELRKELPDRGTVGYFDGTSSNFDKINKITKTNKFKEAYLHHLETGKPIDSDIVDPKTFKAIFSWHSKLYYKFVFAQFSLAPLILITDKSEPFEYYTIYIKKFEWEVEEYPDLLIGDFQVHDSDRKCKYPKDYRLCKNYDNGLVLYERTRQCSN